MTILKKPSERSDKKTIKTLVYGQPGIGKTTLALTSEKPVLIDFDKGMDRADVRFECPSLLPEKFDEFWELLRSDELDNFKTIVIDTIGKFQESMMEYLMEKNPKLRQTDGSPTQKAWGEAKNEFKRIYAELEKKNKDLIFVAHEDSDKKGDIDIYRPDIKGSLKKDLVKDLDLMGYVRSINNKATISFSPNDAFLSKNSTELNGEITLPELDKMFDFFSSKITKSVHEKRGLKRNKSIERENLIKIIKDDISEITDASSINLYLKEYNGMYEMFWDIEDVLKASLMAKAGELKLTYDKDIKGFK